MSEPMHREHAGQIVRRAWVEWARRQPNPKASWLVPWEGLSEPDREVDRQIGEAVIAGEVDIRASYLVAQLGWEWEAFERAARNAASSVLRKALQIFESPPTGDERVDALAMGAAIWIKAELAWRDGPIWNDRKSTPSAAPAVTAPRMEDARIYPCDDCGLMRSKAEGGTTFTVCDACWEKHFGKPRAAPAQEVAPPVPPMVHGAQVLLDPAPCTCGGKKAAECTCARCHCPQPYAAATPTDAPALPMKETI